MTTGRGLSAYQLMAVGRDRDQARSSFIMATYPRPRPVEAVTSAATDLSGERALDEPDDLQRRDCCQALGHRQTRRRRERIGLHEPLGNRIPDLLLRFGQQRWRRRNSWQ